MGALKVLRLALLVMFASSLAVAVNAYVQGTKLIEKANAEGALTVCQAEDGPVLCTPGQKYGPRLAELEREQTLAVLVGGLAWVGFARPDLFKKVWKKIEGEFA